VKFLDKLIGTTEARSEHRAARASLHFHAKASGHQETPAWTDANQRVIDAEQQLPRWRRYATGPTA